MRFNELPISDGTKDAVAAMGYDEATPIQRDAIPHALRGRDVIGKAQTGTGKTAAFGIPLVDALRDAPHGVNGLVLVPTRELALQVTGVLADIATGSRIDVVPVYGGTGFEKQIRSVNAKAPIIVVACPGRLLDLAQRGDIGLGTVSHLVLDEADRMLDMGFIHDMRRVLKLVPKQRQTMLFSATLDQRVRGLAGQFQKDPITVEVAAPTETIDLTEQFHIKVEKTDKQDALLSLLHLQQPGKALVFTRTKHVAKRLAKRLDERGWSSVALQGNMSQGQRERAMAAFREGKARILVATDVAARGLDVPDITHVFNLDLPHEPEAYVHRIGRTGRNGQTGLSFTFVQSDEHKDWRIIQDRAGTRVPPFRLDVTDAPDGPDPKGEAHTTSRGQEQRTRQPGQPGGGGRRRRGPPGQGPRGARNPQGGQRRNEGGRGGPRRAGGRGPRRTHRA